LEQSGLNQDFSRGPVDAPITIVEFSDYECPACKAFHSVIKKLDAENPGKFRIIHKDFPLDSECNPNLEQGGHQDACFAASLARCAGEQGKFWEVSDYLFELREGPGRMRAKMLEVLKSFDLDPQAMHQCIDSKRHYPKIKADSDEGMRLKILGTPSVWLNGRRVDAPVEPVLRAIVQKVLNPQAP
jgi:protein-disulfide isomerase